MLTQHQMKNIGNGNDPDAPLLYLVEVLFVDYIQTFRCKLQAFSEQHARQVVETAYPQGTIASVYIL